MTGGPIADSRLISHNKDVVTFWARSKDKKSGNQSEPFPLNGIEFVRRWSMHILPKGFTRTRCYGGFSNSASEAYLQECTRLLGIQPEKELSLALEPPVEEQTLKCPRCECEIELIESTTRPSWRIVFERLYADASRYSPRWHI